jgi:hypothetical protein
MADNSVLQTWKEISDYVGRTERTLQRWEQQFGFPVHRPSGKSRSSVMALTQEIEEWTRGKPSLVSIRLKIRMSRAELQPSSKDAETGHDPNRSSRDRFAGSGTPQSDDARPLHSVTLERLQRATFLLQKQRDLRQEVVDLLEVQRRLCERLKQSRA